MTYRVLPVDEWERTLPMFAEGHQPHPHYANIIVAEDEDGVIQGMIVAQLAMHLEPAWVAPHHRGKGMWLSLVRQGLASLPAGTHVHATLPKRLPRLAARLGFHERPDIQYEGVA